MQAAIIGCGFIGAVHAQTIKELGHTLALVIDDNLPTAESFAKQWDAEGYGDKRSMALAADIQCIHICTPPMLHYLMVKEALSAGKHVICEKPLSLDPSEAKELMILAQEKNLVHAVTFNVRFFDACQQAKNLISSSDFGKIYLIHGAYLQEFHVLPNAHSWRYKPELAGPMRATTEIGSHWIDLVRYWTGLEIAEISANFGNFTPDRFIKNGIMYSESQENSTKIVIDSEDAAVISIRFSNGAIGNVLLSEISHGRNNYLSLEVTGKNQSVWWHSEDSIHLNQSKKSAGVTSQTNAFGGGFPSTFKAFFKEVYQDMESARPGQNVSYPTFYDGYINTTICAAIYESAQNNAAWIKINY